jgi:hypothetical protein
MRLNDWQKLWVAATAVWALSGPIFYLKDPFPTRDKIDQTRARMVRSDIALYTRYGFIRTPLWNDYESMKMVVRSLSDEHVRSLARGLAAGIQEPGNRLEVTLAGWERELNELRKHQAIWLGAYLLVVLVPSALVYGAGLVTAWVRRGFQKHAQ